MSETSRKLRETRNTTEVNSDIILGSCTYFSSFDLHTFLMECKYFKIVYVWAEWRATCIEAEVREGVT